VLSAEKQFVILFGFIRTENDNVLFSGFRCPDENRKVFHNHSLNNAVWDKEQVPPVLTGNIPGEGTQKIDATGRSTKSGRYGEAFR
jgi:hypothetical protein